MTVETLTALWCQPHHFHADPPRRGKSQPGVERRRGRGQGRGGGRGNGDGCQTSEMRQQARDRVREESPGLFLSVRGETIPQLATALASRPPHRQRPHRASPNLLFMHGLAVYSWPMSTFCTVSRGVLVPFQLSVKSFV